MNMINPKVRKPAYVKNPELITRACSAIENGLTIKQAAQVINVSTPTLYRWMASEPDIRRQIEAARDRMHYLAMETLVETVKLKKNWRACAWLLERHFPETYALRCRRCGSAKMPKSY
jgi:transposase